MSTLRLKTKLLLAFGLVCAITLIEAWTVWHSVRVSDDRLQRIVERYMPQSDRVHELQLTVIRASLETRHAMLVKTAEKRQATLQEIQRLKARADALTSEIEQHLSTEEGRRRFAALKQTESGFWQAAGEVLPLVQAGQVSEAVDVLELRVIPARNEFLGAIRHQLDWQQQLGRESTRFALDQGRFTERIVVALSVLTAMAGLAAAAWMSRHLMALLGGEPGETVAAVQAVAQGELADPVPVRPGDQLSILAAIERMRQQLSALVQEVRQGVDSVQAASDGIAEGNADLSERTAEQAQGLQAAAQAMQQVTDAVQANARSAQEARDMVAEAAEQARLGGQVVQQVVSTMGAIQASSQRIGDIVGTIDGIAFQTNILALNAAVEAARAGEAGRGFAVVAAEVRSLAQRSAQAAREVKQLIHASGETVNQGQQLVGQAGERMQTIVSQVQRVNTVIAEIAQASHAQSEGIAEVGRTVSQLDQGTQQNAAMVQERAAAAASLREQAGRLAAAIGRFHMAG